MSKQILWFLISLETSLLTGAINQRRERFFEIVLEALQIGLMAGIVIFLDWLLIQKGGRWLQGKIHQFNQKQQDWFGLGFSLLRLGIRIFLWVSLISWSLRSIETFRPLQRHVNNLTERIGKQIQTLFTTPFFQLGRTEVTLGFVFWIVFLSIMVFFVSRWISEWIKQRILIQLRVDRGSQETITRAISYALSLIGFIVVLQTAGIDLSSLTVLAGVLGIGFGFGLQSLASNFISGLTILLEHPIKVGDFIEVDGLLGTVEKISIRSTVIRTNDSQYVIVPNNRFIEKNVVNWSYGSPDSRIHVPVGIAYGSDTILVTEALLSAARQDPRVLTNPAPSVWFRKFGESAYEFDLLAWIDRPQDSEPIKSALNFLIEQELKHRGIQVPFPQLDLHVKDIGGLRALINDSPSQQLTQEDSSTVLRQKAARVKKTPALAELLRHISYFSRCTDSEIRMLIELGHRQFFPASRVIFREHDEGDAFYIVLSGAVEIRSERLDQILATLHEGEFFGEISVLTGLPRTATVRCLEDSTLFVVNRETLQKLLQVHPRLAEEIANELAARQQVLQELGLVDANGKSDSSLPPLFWIRERLKTLFSI
ncbi:mechanosensitive ion channel [Candidatus Synechococcus calcipolaris G9]|uniref:Mechanosensitive ion channel n=1 Tax=Candidatus Synechococcus calcipolaris G9 TaxID=1497997 RepID=A0ABT6EYS2_9SYNE|nr:mechanosensitive ion channel domain-containing protein [Candidatus Synechococcus calcipolaris]MDG2990818.1 mechanosensitive ion channel [Candidatus Synechococcus calcipolaris G9]